MTYTPSPSLLNASFVSMLLILSACSGPGPSPSAGSIRWVDCNRLPPAPEQEPAPRCGRLAVPENPERSDSRQIEIAFTVLPRTRAAAADVQPPPLYHLVGGPGSGTGFALRFYTGAFPWPAAQVAPQLRLDRDLVLVDHRGAGESNPLHCPSLDAFWKLRPTFPLDEVTICRDRLAQHADLSAYHVEAAARDLDAVRRALGHTRIQLYGGSYGTSWALAYLRLFEAQVDRAVLVGTLPLDNQVPVGHARLLDRVLLKIFDECSSDPTCRSAFPELAARWETLLRSLDARPLSIPIEDLVDARSESVDYVPLPDGDADEGAVVLTRGALAEAVRSRLVMHMDQRRVPWIIHRAIEGDLRPLAAGLPINADRDPDFAMGLYLSAQCPGTRRGANRMVAATAATALGDHRMRAQLEACSIWPRANETPTWTDPVQSSRPVLMITGALDHETPPEFAEQVAAHLLHSRQVVVPNMGHAPYDVEAECFWGTLRSFYAAPDPDEVDLACLLDNSPMPFFVPPESEATSGEH